MSGDGKKSWLRCIIQELIETVIYWSGVSVERLLGELERETYTGRNTIEKSRQPLGSCAGKLADDAI